MPKLVWDQSGQRKYETGVSHGVLFPMGSNGQYDNGVAWNGLVSVSESPTGAEPSAIYADNIKYLNLLSVEEFEATIEAYTYPDEFAECDGSKELVQGVLASQQARKSFALCYRTKIGTDQNPDAGFKIHIIYGAMAAPTERSYETINDSPEAMTFSWELTTVPVEIDIEGFRPTAHIVIDSTKVALAKLNELLDSLYGTDLEEATLLMPDEIVTLLEVVTP